MSTRILLVDDEEGLRLTLAANLELENFTVVEASSGPAALELARSQQFDLVLSDVRMPGISGVELYRELRKVGCTAPVVLMTAFALEELVDQALAEGAFTVVPKPFDVDRLVRALQRAIVSSTVLVVDDDHEHATTTAAALGASGLKVKAISDSAAALGEMKGGGIDVCVMDLVMPGTDGAELTRQLRSMGSKISVIAVSGHAVPELMQKVAAHGAFGVLRKPFSPRELVQLIARARADRVVRG